MENHENWNSYFCLKTKNDRPTMANRENMRFEQLLQKYMLILRSKSNFKGINGDTMTPQSSESILCVDKKHID